MAGKHLVRFMVLPAVLTIFLTGCGASTTGNAQIGARLYSAYRCASCHMTNGVGGTIGPDLTQNLAEANYDLLKYELANPPAAMAYVTHIRFTPQQIRDLNALAVSSLKSRQ
jgi:mono/diheme cytochrome c family protein